MIPISATDIVNLALDILNTQTISDVEAPGSDEIAATMNRWYDVVRQSLLEEIPWNFASSRKAIPLSATAPQSTYDDAYILPNKFLSLIFIDDESKPLSYWDYTIENGCIYIDNDSESSLNIGYHIDETDVTKYSAKFKIYLATSLAAYTASRLTGLSTVAKALQELAKIEGYKAKAHNGKNNPPRGYYKSRMIASRETYMG